MSELNQIRKKPFVAVCETCFNRVLVDLRFKKTIYCRKCENCKTLTVYRIIGKARKFYKSLKIRWYKGQVKRIEALKAVVDKQKALDW